MFEFNRKVQGTLLCNVEIRNGKFFKVIYFESTKYPYKYKFLLFIYQIMIGTR